MKELEILKEQQESHWSWRCVGSGRNGGWMVGMANLSQEDLVCYDKEFSGGRQWGVVSTGML